MLDYIAAKGVDVAVQGRAARLGPCVCKLETHPLRQSHRRFREWIVNSLKIGGGALHRYTKGLGVPRQKLAAVFDAEGKGILEPMEVVEAKAAFWGSPWQAQDRQPPLDDWWPELRRRANLQERHEMDLSDLKQALQCFRAKVGQGGDKQNPR